MTQVEEIVVQHAKAIRRLSKMMDRRNETLNAWARGGKTKAQLDAYRIADGDFTAAAREVLRLRNALAAAQGDFHRNARAAGITG